MDDGRWFRKRWIGYAVSVSGVVAILVLSESRAPLHYVASSNPQAPTKKTYEETQVKVEIAKVTHRLGDCYLAMRARAPAPGNSSRGNVVVDWNILPSGQVENPVVVRAEVGDEDFKTCLTGEISKILFAPPPDQNKVFVAHAFQFGELKK
ncbi:MAG: AgmX/PglI C-terminal domain-containing protein [Deltaproteobacteria bacterium]|nr:AgmX/PglI C-terminal domain-containing protein [Deltaproteobacteria bacterium]MBI3295371.1 AgmX/PglI C-terminal domain-containing protein [Deltaproteobacteria bacterium]